MKSVTSLPGMEDFLEVGLSEAVDEEHRLEVAVEAGVHEVRRLSEAVFVIISTQENVTRLWLRVRV